MELELSRAQIMALLPEQEREDLLKGYSSEQQQALMHDWRFWGRPKQLLPWGEDQSWGTATICGGRGFGKTRTGAEWTLDKALKNPGCNIGIVAPTSKDARAIMIQGDSGIETIAQPGVLTYRPALTKIEFENGSTIIILTADEPARIRGHNFHFAWIDEPQSWRYEEALDMLDFCMRKGKNPQILATMTPQPNPITYRLTDEEKIASGEILFITGSSYENKDNLSDRFINSTLKRYEGTSLGDQEIHAQIQKDVPGALFKTEWIIRKRAYDIKTGVKFSEPEWVKTVVAVDIAVSTNKTSDYTVITVASEASDGNFYIREVMGMKEVPSVWTEAVVKCFFKYNANYIVVEVNQGGKLVEDAIRHATRYKDDSGFIVVVRGDTLPIKTVNAHIGKRLRAEPVSMLYEKRRVVHMQNFSELEKQMRTFTGAPGRADDYVDSMVYAILELASVPEPSSYSTPQVGGHRQHIISNML